MITKELLDEVIAWDHTVTIGAFNAQDVYTLYFERRWFRRDKMEIRVMRDITTKDFENGIFTHAISERGAWLERLLCQRTNESFGEELTEEKPVKAPVLTLVPPTDDK